jgi:sulfonate transport system substrate-binding protein
MRWPNIINLALISALGLFSSFSHAARPATAAEKLPEKLRISTVSYFRDGKTVFIGPSAIVSEQGWLAAELKKLNIELEWVPAPHQSVGQTINESFANKSIDFAGYGDLPSIILNASGVETRVVIPSGYGSDTFLVVPANSPAKTIEDLKGKKIAVHRGRPWELPFSRLLETKNLTYKDFKIFNINPSAGAAAIAAGGVDALYTLNDAYLLEDKKVGRIIWSTKQAPADWKMRAELWGSKEFIDKYPQLTQLVATAYVKAAYWSAQDENRDELIRINARSGTPESVVRREYAELTLPWKERWSPLFTATQRAHYEHAVSYALEKKLIRRNVSVDNLIETRFTEQALRDLKLEDFWAQGLRVVTAY